jgi:hypothetical protein
MRRLSLTPALSRWEREKRPQRLLETTFVSGSIGSLKTIRVKLLFPLPAGEGQGEGERPAINTLKWIKS